MTALRHHHLKSGKMPKAGDPVTGRAPILFNDDVILSPLPARQAAGVAVSQRRRR